MRTLLAATTDDGLRFGLVATAFALGMRHGVDWDHVAAIGDLTGSQASARRGLVLATAYGVGHAAVVVALGLIAILGGQHVPDGLDEAMARVVGATLVVLGGYLVLTVVRHGRRATIRSRWGLARDGLHLVGAFARRGRPQPTPHPGDVELVDVEHEHPHAHDGDHVHDHADVHVHMGETPGRAVAVTIATAHAHAHVHRRRLPMPADPFPRRAGLAALAVGALHGVGAETPTQVLLLATAAGTAGQGTGIVLLVAFVAGLLLSNTALALVAASGMLDPDRPSLGRALLVAIAGGVSFAVGLPLVLGS